MSNTVKLFVQIGLVALLTLTSIKLWTLFFSEWRYERRTGPCVAKAARMAVVSLLTLIVVLGLLCEYNCFPFEWPVKMELVATVDIEEDADPIRNHRWYCVYGEYDGHNPSSLYHWDELEKYIDPDFDHYTYVVSYGKPIKALSYNIIKSVGGPYAEDIKQAHPVFGEPFDPWTIYIYKIPRLRIDA